MADAHIFSIARLAHIKRKQQRYAHFLKMRIFDLFEHFAKNARFSRCCYASQLLFFCMFARMAHSMYLCSIYIYIYMLLDQYWIYGVRQAA